MFFYEKLNKYIKNFVKFFNEKTTKNKEKTRELQATLRASS